MTPDEVNTLMAAIGQAFDEVAEDCHYSEDGLPEFDDADKSHLMVKIRALLAAT